MIFVRSLAFNIVMFGAGTVLSLFGNLLKLIGSHRILQLGQIWARLTLGALAPLCRIHIEITGRAHLPAAGPAIIAAQHQSAFDTLVWLTLLPRPAYVLKQELLKLPLIGGLLLPSGFIAVDRAGAATALRKMLADCRAAAAQGRQIVIFPEGTRVAPGERVSLQPGVAALAKHLNLPVIPAATDSGRLWGRQAFQKFPGRLHVKIYPPLPASTGREQLLDQLARYFYDGLVDNSVDQAANQFTDDTKKIF
jgi:1-acyl-sn-glycerol-3-phosphate acyltransferase